MPKRTANFTQQLSEKTKILLNQIEELREKGENYVEALVIPKEDFLPTRICHSPYQLQ